MFKFCILSGTHKVLYTKFSTYSGGNLLSFQAIVRKVVSKEMVI